MMVIVDTNVAVVANGKSEQASEECVDTCIGKLEQIIRGETKLVLDADWIILDEYSRNLNSSGKPGTGDRFLVWCLRNWTIPEQCELVSVTSIENLERSLKNSLTTPHWKTLIRTIGNSLRLPLPTAKTAHPASSR